MFPVTDGMQIVSEYVQGHMPASEIIEKYHLSSRQVLFSWMDRFVNGKEWVSERANGAARNYHLTYCCSAIKTYLCLSESIHNQNNRKR